MKAGATGQCLPLVLFPDVILFAQIDEIGDWFGGKQLKAVDDIDLNAMLQWTRSRVEWA